MVSTTQGDFFMSTVRTRERRDGASAHRSRRLKALLTLAVALLTLTATAASARAAAPAKQVPTPPPVVPKTAPLAAVPGGSSLGPLYFDERNDSLPVGFQDSLSLDTASDVGPTPYFIQIWDLTAGTLVGTCGSGTHCVGGTSAATAGAHAFVATVALYGASYPPPSIQLMSQTLFVTWNTSNWGMSLIVKPIAGSSQVLAQTSASVDVGPTPYYIEYFQETGPGTGTFLYRCGSGSTCPYTFTPTPGAYLVAFIASAMPTVLPPSDTQTSSNVTLE
jgi:hypothetical protein